jgi:histidine triad (HIT) family protein
MIVRGERPADILFQDESIIVFRDIRPHAPVHLLIVSKRHIRSLMTQEKRMKISFPG